MFFSPRWYHTHTHVRTTPGTCYCPLLLLLLTFMYGVFDTNRAVHDSRPTRFLPVLRGPGAPDRFARLIILFSVFYGSRAHTVCRASRLTRLRRAWKNERRRHDYCNRHRTLVFTEFWRSIRFPSRVPDPVRKKIRLKILLRSDTKLEQSVTVLNRRRFLKRPNATREKFIHYVHRVEKHFLVVREKKF